MDHPDVTKINELVQNVDHFPVSSRELAMLAKTSGADPDTTHFFESMPGTVFSDQKDLLQRARVENILADEDENEARQGVPRYDAIELD